MTKKDKLTILSAGKDAEHLELITLLVEMQQVLWKKVWQFFIKFSISIQSIGPHPSYLPKWNKNLCSHKKLYVNVYMGFLHIFKSWKQHRCLSRGGWINKLWFICTMEYYSLIKKKRSRLLINATKMNLKCIMQSGSSQIQKPHTVWLYDILEMAKNGCQGLKLGERLTTDGLGMFVVELF